MFLAALCQFPYHYLYLHLSQFHTSAHSHNRLQVLIMSFTVTQDKFACRTASLANHHHQSCCLQVMYLCCPHLKIKDIFSFHFKYENAPYIFINKQTASHWTILELQLVARNHVYIPCILKAI